MGALVIAAKVITVVVIVPSVSWCSIAVVMRS